MLGKDKAITLRRSPQFKESFLDVRKRLTIDRNIVTSVGYYGRFGNDVVWAECIIVHRAGRFF